MKLADLDTVPAGTPLATIEGRRVIFTGTVRVEINGRTYTHATTRTADGRTGVYKPRSLRNIPDPYPVIINERTDLARAGHTITVERVDRATARAWIGIVRDRWEALIGRRTVVERHDGRLFKVCAIEGVDGVPDAVIDATAEGTARTYGARYVPAVS